MPSAQAPGFTGLFDSRGNLITPGPSGTAWRRTADDDRLRPPPKNHYGDWIDLLSTRDSRRLVSESRAIGTRGMPFALLDQKADYVAASDFRPQFKGTDTAYGTTALPLLESYLQIANLRGWLFDWKTSWRLTIPLMAQDARVYVLLTKWDNGMPALQFLERHRIGQRKDEQLVGADDAKTTITDDSGRTRQITGAYKGLRIKDGIIITPAGTEVAYRVLGSDPDGSEDQDISARDLFPICRPAAFSEGSGVPELARALFDFIGLELAQSAQLDQQIEDARLTLIETNATGKYDPASGFGGTAGVNASQPGDPTVESKRGRTRFVKTGFAVTAHESARPSDQWMNFDARTHSRGAATVRWRSEMLDPAALKAAANRALQDQINTLIRESFSTVAKGAERALNYIAAVLSSPEIGYLPLNADSMKWGIAPPPWFEVDRASAKYDLDDVAAGRVSMATLHARDGHDSIEVFEANARLYEKAEEVKKRHPSVPLEIIMGDLGKTVQRTGAPESQNPGDQQAA